MIKTNTMKRITLSFSLVLAASCGWTQSIDSTALAVLQKAYDRLEAMDYISYKLEKQDTMIREGCPITVTQSTLEGEIEKDVFWHIRFGERSAWLIRRDTLYKKSPASSSQTSYTIKWNSHELASFSIYNLVGQNRPTFTKDVAALKFCLETKNSAFFVIDIVKKPDYRTTEIQSLAYFNRYWIDKKTMLPLRRMMYSKRLENGKVAIDIYDFTAKINTGKKRSFDPETFLKGLIEMEVKKNSIETIGTDRLAPAFSATELSTGEKTILPALKGKVVLFDFWYLSCMPCRILMPKIQHLKNKFKAQGLEVIGINMVDTSATQIQDFLSARGISYRQFFKPENMTNSYKLYAFPTTIIIGRDGRIKLVEIGEAPDTEAKLEQAISAALSIPPKPLATSTNQY